MSAAKATKMMMEANQYRVQKLLGWDALRYNQFQMDTGLEYLNRVLDGDEFGISYQSRNSMFWRWWRNHWDKRDEQFIWLAPDLNTEERVMLFNSLHDPETFRFKPQSEIYTTTKEEALCQQST